MFAKRFLLIFAGVICLSRSPSAAATEPPPQFLTMWGIPSGVHSAMPWGVAVNAAGYVYVADQGDQRVYKFTDTGQMVLSWATQAAGIAVDATGRIFVADYWDNSVLVFTSDGVLLYQFGEPGTDPGQLNAPSDVTVSPSGTVYVANPANYRVEKYDRNGSFLGTLGVGIHAVGVAVDAAGNLFVSDSENKVICKFDPAGNLLLSFGGPGSAPGLFNGPVGLALDSAGDLYAADYGNNRIQKFSPNGSLLSYWGTQGTGAGQFNLTLDVAIGPDGSIYVTDSGNNRVQKFGYGVVSAAVETWGAVKARYRH